MGKEYHVAVVGATGAVGTRMIELLAETSLPIASVRLLASKRSAGQEIQFKGQPLIVEELVPESFEGIDLALFSAGGSISEKFAPEAVKRGAVVVDNTSHFRMAKDVPLVVPEPGSLEKSSGNHRKSQLFYDSNDGGLRTNSASVWLRTNHRFNVSSCEWRRYPCN